jgi:hypothetical protein
VGPAHCLGTFSEPSTRDVLALKKKFWISEHFGISDKSYRTVIEQLCPFQNFLFHFDYFSKCQGVIHFMLTRPLHIGKKLLHNIKYDLTKFYQFFCEIFLGYMEKM